MDPHNVTEVEKLSKERAATARALGAGPVKVRAVPSQKACRGVQIRPLD